MHLPNAHSPVHTRPGCTTSLMRTVHRRRQRLNTGCCDAGDASGTDRAAPYPGEWQCVSSALECRRPNRDPTRIPAKQSDADAGQPSGPWLLIGDRSGFFENLTAATRHLQRAAGPHTMGIGGVVKAISLIDSVDGHGTRRRQSQPVNRGRSS